MRTTLCFLGLAAALSGCGGTANTPTPNDAAAPTDSAPTDTGAAVTDTPPVATDTSPVATDTPPTATDSGTPSSAAMHGCAESNFVDQTAGTNNDRMIMTRGTTSAFDYPCMTIRAGQSVIFMWAFSRHPLAPGLAPGETGTPSEMSPIAAHNTGSVYTVRFPSAGVFPFFCSVHPGTMKGVVRVVP